MLLLFLQYLQQAGIALPMVFFYVSTRMMLAAMTSVVITIFCGPFFIRKLYALKVGQPIRYASECPLLAQLHKKKKDTPTMGGIILLFSLWISLVLWMDFTSAFTWILLFTSGAFGLLGAVDDYIKLRQKQAWGLSGKKKLLIQSFVTFLVSSYLLLPSVTQIVERATGIKPPSAKEFSVEKGEKGSFLTTKEYINQIYLPFKKTPLLVLQWPLLLFLLAFFVTVGSSNAVNLTDGLDGLAAGCLVMVASVFALIAFLSNHVEIARYLHILYIDQAGEIAVFLSSVAGACTGFLWYNGHPAQVFMGDTGSLSLGGIIGIASILLKREFLLAIVGGVFVLEALSVILQVLSYRLRGGKRIFLCSPLHHHFEYKGWPETKVVLRFWIIALFLAILGIASLKFQ
ncbi:MAG: phospho-N-acetylmuramoyl-pentapeptide-transferase [Chlamydiota bacterium]